MLSKKQINIVCYLVCSMLLFIGCSNSTNVIDDSQHGTSNNPDLTIDNSSVIPVLTKNNPKALVILHNESNQLISNIQYKVSNNLTHSSIMVNNCRSIPAHSSCRLTITIPASLTQNKYSAAAQLTVSYISSGQKQQISNLFNFQVVNLQESGLHLNPVNLTSSNHNLVHGVAYLYAGGNPDNSYTIESMSLDNLGYHLIQGDLSGRQIKPGTIIPIEVEGNAPQLTTFVNLKIQAQDSSKQINMQSSLGIISPTNFKALTASFLPLINFGESSAYDSLQKIYFQNLSANDIKINLSVPDYPDLIQINEDSPCNSGSIIKAWEVCEVDFLPMPYIDKLSHATLQATADNGTSALAIVSWFNPAIASVLILSLDDDYILIPKGESREEHVSVYNPSVSDIALDSIPNPQALSGSASGTVTYNGCPEGLGAYLTCPYTTSLFDNAEETGQNFIQFGYHGSYDIWTASAKQIAKLSSKTQNIAEMKHISITGLVVTNYQTVNQESANLQITTPTNPFSLTIIGNGTESQMANVTVTNKGKGAAYLDQIYFDQLPSYLSLDNHDCINKSPLKQNASCQLIIKLGPFKVDGDDNLNGKAKIIISGNFKNNETLFKYNILSSKIALAAEFLPVTDVASGDGSQDNPYIFDGAQATPKKVIWRLSNIGELPQTLNAINLQSVAPDQWLIDAKNSSCYNGKNPYEPSGYLDLRLDSKDSGSGSSCDIVFIDSYGGIPGEDAIASISEYLKFPEVTVTQEGSNISFNPVVKEGGMSEVWVKKIMGSLNIDASFTDQGAPDNALQINYQASNTKDYGAITLIASQLPMDLFDYHNYTTSAPDKCRVIEDPNDNRFIQMKCILNADGNGNVKIPLNQDQLYSGDYNFMVKFSNNVSEPRVIAMNNYAINLTAKGGHGYIYLTDPISNQDLESYGWNGICKHDAKVNPLIQKGYRYFEAVNLDDSSGYTDNLPEFFPLFNLQEKQVTYISKALSEIPEASGRGKFKDLFHYPFTETIGWDGIDSKVYVHASNGKYVAQNGILVGPYPDCANPDNRQINTLWLWSSEVLANIVLKPENLLRSYNSNSATPDQFDSSQAYSCNNTDKIDKREILCTAY